MLKKKQILFLGISLAAVTFIAFWQITQSDFINLDDPVYLTENVHIQDGLTLNGIGWAFTTMYAEFWHPLTWLSHMVDVQIFGMDPRGHHLTNLLFHVASTLLLLLLLHRMTKSLWPSAFVAALFALHPLHVESVAWVAERKDVLSAFFLMLTIGAYAFYAERPGLPRYMAVLLFFAFGLMAKPMLVTLPLVLLLLDYWPLQRFQPEEAARKIQVRGEQKPVLPCPPPSRGRVGAGGTAQERRKRKAVSRRGESEKSPGPKGGRETIRPLLLEKIPLFALAVLSTFLAYIAQGGEAIGSPDSVPPFERFENVFVSYLIYLGKMFWPTDLAVYYPYPAPRPLWQAGGAVLLFSLATWAAIRMAKKRPYFMVGWLWYAATLLPVIGIIQIGTHAMADRYTYISLIGPFIILAWGMPEIFEKWRFRKEALVILSGLCLLGLLFLTRIQVGFWRNSITLFDHALKVTDCNPLAYCNRGTAYWKLGNHRQAMEDYNKAIECSPKYPTAYYNRGVAHTDLGNYRQGIEDYNRAIELNPRYGDAYNNRGNAYRKIGFHKQAVGDYEKAIALHPRYAPFYYNRGIAYLDLGDARQAMDDYTKAIELYPKYGDAYVSRASVHLNLGRYPSAIEDCQKALRLNPQYAAAYNTRGNAYTRLGHFRQALEDYGKAIELNPKYAEAYNNRGNAYAGLGQYRAAVEECGKAIALNPEYAAAYNNRAGIYGSMGNYQQAIEDCNKAVSLNPRYAEAYNNRGNAYAKLGKYRRAIDDYASALAINPDYAMAYHNRAAAYLGLGDYRKAIEDLKRGARLGSESAQQTLKKQGIGW